MFHYINEATPNTHRPWAISKLGGFDAVSTSHDWHYSDSTIFPKQAVERLRNALAARGASVNPSGAHRLKSSASTSNNVHTQPPSRLHTSITLDCGKSLRSYIPRETLSGVEPRARRTASNISNDDIRAETCFVSHQVVLESNAQPGLRHTILPKKRFYCEEPNCSVSCRRKSDLPRHRASKHHGPETKLYICSFPGCRRWDSRKDKLQAHARSAHPGEHMSNLIGESRSSQVAVLEEAFCGTRDAQETTASRLESCNDPSPKVSASHVEEPTANVVSEWHISRAASTIPRATQPYSDSNSFSEPIARGQVLETLRDAESAGCTSTVEQIPRASNDGLTVDRLSRSAEKMNFACNTIVSEEFSGKANDRTSNRASSEPPGISGSRQIDCSTPSNSNLCCTPDAHVPDKRFSRQSTAPPQTQVTLPCDGDQIPSASGYGGNIWDIPYNTPGWSSINRRSIRKDDDDDDDDGWTGRDSSGHGQGKRRKLSSRDHEPRLGCIGHHPDNPARDKFRPKCRTIRKKFISQLKKHHSRHGWFYCTRCVRTFGTSEECEAHHAQRNCAFKCVTVNCDEYGTFPATKCSHAVGDSDSGDAVWKALFRIYRQDETIPTPEVWRGHEEDHSTLSSATSTQDLPSFPTSPVPRTGLSPRVRRGRTTPSSATSRRVAEPLTLTDGRALLLETVAEQLWLHIHSQSHTPPNFVRDLYQQAMGAAQPIVYYPDTGCEIQPLEHFVQQAWMWANRDIQRTKGLYDALRVFARRYLSSVDHSGLLPPAFDNVQPQNDATPLTGLGGQFDLGSIRDMAPASGMPDSRQPWQHQPGSYVIQPEYASPWTGLQSPVPGNHTENQFSLHGSQATSTGLPDYSTHRQDIGTLNLPQSQNTLHSGSLSSYGYPAGQGTFTRNTSYPTGPTSIAPSNGLRSDSQNVQNPHLSTMNPGLSTGSIHPSLIHLNSGDFGDNTSNCSDQG